MLRPGDGKEANFLYVDESVKFDKYTSVYIKPIELWKSDDPDSTLGKLSPDDQQLLVSLLNTALVTELQKNYTIVNQPGPNVLVIHAAVTDSKKSKPVVNLISTVMPIGLVLSTGKRLITGTGSGVGVVNVEGELIDGASGKRVAAFVDSRAGTKALRTKFSGRWGDVKLAFDWWAERLDTRLQLFSRGDFGTESL